DCSRPHKEPMPLHRRPSRDWIVKTTLRRVSLLAKGRLYNAWRADLLPARLFSYKARSAPESRSAGFSPGEYSFQPVDQRMGMVSPCQSNSSGPSLESTS